ncbi:subtilisin-like protein [Ascobolus immersus RN42]|uniref:Subtilisin-like protein n=1 Tax=Ascobolus immersus RN42 TaxID=1160509 RepID=A0A3N4IF25_ASCIM|nr:subtilisin-like protein [Ascobolus immersus RN42]
MALKRAFLFETSPLHSSPSLSTLDLPSPPQKHFAFKFSTFPLATPLLFSPLFPVAEPTEKVRMAKGKKRSLPMLTAVGKQSTSAGVARESTLTPPTPPRAAANMEPARRLFSDSMTTSMQATVANTPQLNSTRRRRRQKKARPNLPANWAATDSASMTSAPTSPKPPCLPIHVSTRTSQPRRYSRLVFTGILSFMLLCLAGMLYWGSLGSPVRTPNPLNSVLGHRQVSSLQARQVGRDYWEEFYDLTDGPLFKQQGWKGTGGSMAILDENFRLTSSVRSNHFNGGLQKITGMNIVEGGTDTNPSGSLTSHGLQCLSVASAKSLFMQSFGPDLSILAIALEASEYSSRLDEYLLDAAKAAFDASCDVLSVSLGIPSNWHGGKFQTSIDALVGKGLLIVASASNFAEFSANSLFEFSSSNLAITVGNYASSIAPGYEFEVSSALAGQNYKFHFDFTEDCALFVKKSADHIGCYDNLKSLRAETFVRAIFVWGIKPESWETVEHTSGSVVLGYLSDALEVEQLKDILLDGPATVVISPESTMKVLATSNDSPDRYSVASASGYGPTYELHGGVDIIAPGTSVIVAYGSRGMGLSDYGSASGTSFATPLVASILADYVAALGGRNSLGVRGMHMARDKIITCGVPVPLPDGIYADGSGILRTLMAPAHWQGSGKVSIANLLSQAHVSPPSIALNDTMFFRGTHTLVFYNRGPTPMTVTVDDQLAVGSFEFEEVPSVAFNSASHSIRTLRRSRGFASHLVASVDVDRTAKIVQPGTSCAFVLIFHHPIASAEERVRKPIYSGWIVFSTSDGRQQRVRYVGAASAQRELQIFQSEPTITSGGSSIQTPFVVELASTTSTRPFLLTVRAVLGTRQAIVEYIPAEEDLKTLDPVHCLTAISLFDTESLNPNDKQNYDDILIRNFMIDGRNDKGVLIVKAGRYIPRVRLLSLFGDPQVWEHWQKLKVDCFPVVWQILVTEYIMDQATLAAEAMRVVAGFVRMIMKQVNALSAFS